MLKRWPLVMGIVGGYGGYNGCRRRVRCGIAEQTGAEQGAVDGRGGAPLRTAIRVRVRGDHNDGERRDPVVAQNQRRGEAHPEWPQRRRRCRLTAAAITARCGAAEETPLPSSNVTSRPVHKFRPPSVVRSFVFRDPSARDWVPFVQLCRLFQLFVDQLCSVKHACI